ncbi:DUF4145 domain-containing protein [bacterium]|nr:DUF4145 domain-containing protein [bacterium]
MIETKILGPEYGKMEYVCPHCNVFADQQWNIPNGTTGFSSGNNYHLHPFRIARCRKCSNLTLWLNEELVYPTGLVGIPPNEDIPDEIRILFNEAREIGAKSPRGAAALLRLVVQKLCLELGEEGKNLNSDIASMVEKGLPKAVQHALDVVRVIGNEAVHPGELNLEDDRETAEALFELVNIIAQDRISNPKRAKELFDKLPQSKKEQVEKRDSRQQTKSD